MMRVALLAATIWLLTAAIMQAQARDYEDGDTRTNVSVRTKRSSIGPRSLPRLAELAEKNSPRIAQLKAEMDQARLEMENARMVFLPSLDVEAKHGLADRSPTEKDVRWRVPWTSSLSLVLSENLYDAGASLTKLKVAETKFEQARLNYEFYRDQQLLNVAQAYYDWAALVVQREIDENNRDLLRRQFNALEAQYKQGLKTKRDVLRIETEVRRVDMDVLKRDNDLDLAFQKLAAAIGLTREGLVKEEIEGEEPKPYAGNEPAAPELKASDHRQARILALVNQQSDYEADLARLEYMPRFHITGNVGYYNHDYMGTPKVRWEETQSFGWEALVTLKYNLWDFGQRRRAVEIAKVKAAGIADKNRQTLFDLSNDLRDIWNRLREYRENVKLSRDLLAIEQQSYSLLYAEYRTNRVTYLDLITSQRSFIDARSRFGSAYFNLRKQQMLYSFHKGELSDVLRR